MKKFLASVSPLDFNWIFYTYAIIISLFYSFVFTGNVLGFINRYYFWDVIVITGLVFLTILGVYLSTAPKNFKDSLQFHTRDKKIPPRALEFSLIFCGIILIIVFIIFPLMIWPQSNITSHLPFDAALYHFPKAVQLFQSGSIWDQASIAYWEYPFGYENIISFAIVLTNGEHLFGLFHAVIALFFVGGLLLLGKRLTKLSWGVLLFSLILVLLSDYYGSLLTYFDRWINISQLKWIVDSNPWTAFGSRFVVVGKNDLFLAAAVVSMILHAPLSGNKSDTDSVHPVGLAMGSMLVFSIKPNGALLAIPLWALTLFWLIKRDKIKVKTLWVKLSYWTIIMIPGLLWALRNLLIMNSLFSDSTLTLQNKSIVTLLPQLAKTGIPFSLKLILFLLALTIILLILQKKYLFFSWIIVLSLLLVFIYTPASVNISDDGSFIVQWRFGLALLGFLVVFLLSSLEGVIQKTMTFLSRSNIFSWLTIFIIIGVTLSLISENRNLIKIYPENQNIMKRYFDEPVGEDGYFSAYDYLQKNFEGAYIRIDNGLPYYAYGDGYKNFPTVAPYALVQETNDMLQIDTYLIFAEENSIYPDVLASNKFQENWFLVYEDSISRIYHLKEE